jgi:hypothetical protein
MDPVIHVITDQNPPTSNPVEQFLKLVEEGNVPGFQAEMMKHPLNVTAGSGIFNDRRPCTWLSVRSRWTSSDS